MAEQLDPNELLGYKEALLSQIVTLFMNLRAERIAYVL